MSQPESNAKDDVLSLPDQLAQIRGELGRLADLLTEQAASKRRRRRLTIRMLLGVFVAFGILFAGYGNLYRSARDQDRCADDLNDQAAFMIYQPRKSFLVSLLPGDSRQPPSWMMEWLGNDFFSEIVNVSTNVPTQIKREAKTVLRSVADLPSLKRLRLTGLTCGTIDLEVLGELKRLESLDLTRTILDYGAMPWLKDSNLKWFAAAHTKFSDSAMVDLCRNSELQYVNLERTAVSDKSVFALTGLPHLRYVNLRRTPVTKEAVTKLSKQLPHCLIDWEPLVLGSPNSAAVRLARRQRIRLGTQMPSDTRPGHRASGPLDQMTYQNPYGYLPAYGSPSSPVNVNYNYNSFDSF